ncbi:protein of unknown function [Kyrpidia spormannii]|uniref:Uncharacterized protein n=2 Tax=Kyrpidia spormannii TaxID=2055160 RepID=A0ACA8Z7U6_9BACL|nr:protein of unknown function [Kyrpidia spormannii]CAB3392183.1 protein of unknown function [Kyrpidia spormannii]
MADDKWCIRRDMQCLTNILRDCYLSAFRRMYDTLHTVRPLCFVSFLFSYFLTALSRGLTIEQKRSGSHRRQ